MSDLRTFHRLLVRQLAATAPARLQGGLALSDIRDSLLPYRRFRGVLGIHMEEDYDALLLQLAAGDEGLASLDDPAVLRLFQAERRSPNPDLMQLDVHGAATITLDEVATAQVLSDGATTAPAGDAAAPDRVLIPDVVDDRDTEDDALPLDAALAAVHRPPVPPAPTAPAAAPPPAIRPDEPMAAAEPQCAFCGGALPTGRAIRFCPHCGQNQKTIACPECGAEAEIGWKHCVTCGSGLPTF